MRLDLFGISSTLDFLQDLFSPEINTHYYDFDPDKIFDVPFFNLFILLNSYLFVGLLFIRWTFKRLLFLFTFDFRKHCIYCLRFYVHIKKNKNQCKKSFYLKSEKKIVPSGTRIRDLQIWQQTKKKKKKNWEREGRPAVNYISPTIWPKTISPHLWRHGLYTTGAFFWGYSGYSYSSLEITEYTEFPCRKERSLCFRSGNGIGGYLRTTISAAA